MAGLYLSPRYDAPKPTPEFHRECWRRYCSDIPAAATAAPRSHAKSTALTHDFIIACVLFRAESYIIIVGSSEEKAAEHLNDIATELRENDALAAEFRIKRFLRETSTDIVVECLDGHQFRILARGAEQKIRGTKWRGQRPGLIIGDDLEDDEQVESKDRRRKFRRWFFRACKPALRRGGRIRIHGTILHNDSLLAHLMKNKSWDSKVYKAQKSFSDFSDILWPEQFPARALKAIRQEFIDEGDSAGFSQEYLNDPKDDENRYLRKEHLLAMSEDDYDTFKVYSVGCDFAVSKLDAANRTSFTIGGRDVTNILHFVDQRVGRWDTAEWIDELFSVQLRWTPDTFYAEDGVIWQAVWPIIRTEMAKRDIWMNFVPIRPIKDKATRGRSFQKRCKGGGCKFDKQAGWYDEYEEEILDFTGIAEAVLDDQFDSSAILCKGLEDAPPLEEEDAMTDEERAFEAESLRWRQTGRNAVTGY